jgi:gas vesicle protein
MYLFSETTIKYKDLSTRSVGDCLEDLSKYISNSVGDLYYVQSELQEFMVLNEIATVLKQVSEKLYTESHKVMNNIDDLTKKGALNKTRQKLNLELPLIERQNERS